MLEYFMLDSYQKLFHLISKEDFFNFGLDNLITISSEVAIKSWEELISKIEHKHNKLFIRGMGRNGQSNEIVKKMYQSVFGLQINIDRTNNQKPTLFLEKGTGKKKHVDIENYQVSHVFSRTKNVYCFTAPWNVVYIPKVLDPFTGHEAKGVYVQDFQKRFQEAIYKKYSDLIEDYNKKMIVCQKDVAKWLKSNAVEVKLFDLVKEFDPIIFG